MHNFDDELARRRAARRGKAEGPSEDDDMEEETPQLSWSDTFAMIIAAYQVLLPMILAMAGVMIAAYFLFRFLFS